MDTGIHERSSAEALGLVFSLEKLIGKYCSGMFIDWYYSVVKEYQMRDIM